MAITAKDLRHKAGKLAKEQKDILDQASDKLTPDQEKKFDDLHAEEMNLLRQAQKIEAVESVDREEIENARELEKTLKKGDLSPEKRKEAESLAINEYLRTGAISTPGLEQYVTKAKADKDDSKLIDEAYRNLGLVRANTQNTTAATGGYTIPQGFQAELDKATKAFGGMYEVSRIWKTSTGNSVKWPNVDDTANSAYQLSESGNAETSAEDVNFGQQTFDAYKWTSGLLRITHELLEDSAFNMPQVIQELSAERIWRGTNTAFTTGDGSSKPNGVVTAAAYGKSFAAQGSPTNDEIIDLIHTVDPSYRRSPSCRFMFHDTTLRNLKKLKDGNNLPIYQMSYRDGEPDTINGYKFTINQAMASGTTNSAKIMLFGDFSKYVIRQVKEMRIVRLNERFADTDEVGFVIFFRIDGDLLNAGQNPIKYGRNDAT